MLTMLSCVVDAPSTTPALVSREDAAVLSRDALECVVSLTLFLRTPTRLIRVRAVDRSPVRPEVTSLPVTFSTRAKLIRGRLSSVIFRTDVSRVSLGSTCLSARVPFSCFNHANTQSLSSGASVVLERVVVMKRTLGVVGFRVRAVSLVTGMIGRGVVVVVVVLVVVVVEVVVGN